MENVSAFVVILGPDAEPELVRNSIRLIPGVASVSAQIDLELPRDEVEVADAEADGPPCRWCGRLPAQYDSACEPKLTDNTSG